MPTKRPAKRETPAAADGRVEQFLDKARPIIASYGGLTENCRGLLADVARDLGLSDQQMSEALRSFQDGSQAKTPGKPPPLPRRTEAATVPDDPSPQPAESAAAPATATPPPAPTPPRPPDSQRGSKSPATPAPPPAPAAIDDAESSTTRSIRSPSQRTEAVQPASGAALPPATAVPVSPPPAEPPPPPGPKPREAFCAELRKAFAKVGKEGALSEKAERKLARSGKTSFDLSEIYARHLVYEVAAECSVPVISQVRLARQQKPSDTDDQREAAIREFLDRVTPIIAEQRGINLRSRVKMGAVARELGMSDDDVEQALKSLQKSADSPEQSVQWLTEREEAYRERLRRSVEKRSGSVLTFTKEHEYIESGVDRYGVTHAFVRETLRVLMAEHSVRYVSAKQAREHVARLVDERMGTSQRIVLQERRRLQLEGAQWGLDPADVDNIIREKHIEIGDVARSRQVRKAALLVACAMLAVGVCGGLAALVMYRSFSPPAEDPAQAARATTPGTEAPPTPDPVGVERRPRLPDWWDGPLANYIVQAGQSSPNLRDTLKKIRSEDPAVRGQAYAELVRRVPDPQPEAAGAADAQHILRLAHLEGVLTGCHALDPDDEAAGCLRDALLACVPLSHSELPNNAMTFRKAFWAVRVALASLNHDDLKPERAADLSLAVGHAVGTALPPSEERSQSYLTGLGALCNHLYRLLISSASTQPNVVLGLHATLAFEATRYLDAANRLMLDTDLLVAALPALGNTWRDWEKLILRCILSSDPSNVLRIVDAYERLKDESLQEFMRQPLLNRGGVRDADTVAEVASRVRRALGGGERAALRTAAERFAVFQQKATEALENIEADPERPDRLLTEVVRLQHASTLGCALAQQELGFPTFDEVIGRKPESLISSRTAADSGAAGSRLSPRSRREAAEKKAVSTVMQRQVTTEVAMLRNLHMSNAMRRATAVRWLATMRPRLPDLDPKHGDAIAKYLLLFKPTPEHQQIALRLKAVCSWQSVRLGLANYIEESRLRPEHLREVLSAALGHEVTFEEDDSWRTKMRRRLLLSVVDELSGASVSVAAGPAVYDRASNLLHDYYTIQARLHGVLPAKYLVTETPLAVLELLIDQYASELSGHVQRPDDRQYVSDLSHQLAAAKYVGHDNLAQTLLLERIWLRLLAAGVAAEHPDRADAADELVTQLGRRDATAKHILTQLRNGHETLLRMWQLSCQP